MLHWQWCIKFSLLTNKWCIYTIDLYPTYGECKADFHKVVNGVRTLAEIHPINGASKIDLYFNSEWLKDH